jgi:uncharacterized membrane protein
MKTKEFLNQLDDEAIVDTIRRAEARTSGEIRVHISRRAIEDPLAAAEKRFVALGMTKTARRNGVLIYIAPRTQRFAIIGDSGIHERVSAKTWGEIVSQTEEKLRSGDLCGAVLDAIAAAGDLLAQHFPREPDDVNELPDELTRD